MGDWMPRKRDDVLNFGKVWGTVLARNAAAWGIPVDEVTGLVDLTAQAETILAAAKGADRTPTVTAKCKAAFEALEKKLRYLKERYIHTPPLKPADYPTLLLTAPDTVKTPVPPPSGFAEADISYPGPGVLALHCRPMQGQPALDPRSDYGYKIYYGVMPQGGATVEQATGRKRLLMKVPATGDDLPHSVWTRRKTRKWTFTKIAAVPCTSVYATKTPRVNRGRGVSWLTRSFHDRVNRMELCGIKYETYETEHFMKHDYKNGLYELLNNISEMR